MQQHTAAQPTIVAAVKRAMSDEARWLEGKTGARWASRFGEP